VSAPVLKLSAPREGNNLWSDPRKAIILEIMVKNLESKMKDIKHQIEHSSYDIDNIYTR
jgi:hypothetical protein